MPSPVCPARSWSSPRIAQERPNASRGASDGGETTFHGKAENPHPKGRPKTGKFRRGPPADAVRALHPARATGQRQSVVPEMPPVPQKGPLTRKQGRFSPLRRHHGPSNQTRCTSSIPRFQSSSGARRGASNLTGGLGVRLFMTKHFFVAPELRIGLVPLLRSTVALGYAF